VLEVPTAYINCWKEHTRNGVLERAAKDLVGAAVSKKAPARELLDRIEDGLDSPSVIILDEVDQLQDKNVLYDFYSVPGLGFICIANREVDLFAELDDRVRSRVSVGYRVQFDRYTVDTVTEILDRRATEGLENGSVTRETLRQIAEFADGDARHAITSLRVAARKADQEGLSKIPPRLVEESVLDAEEEVRQKTISKLNDHQRVLYECVRDCGPLIQKELFECYFERHPDPLSKRSLRKTHLPKLLHYNLMEVNPEGVAKTYRLIE